MATRIETAVAIADADADAGEGDADDEQLALNAVLSENLPTHRRQLSVMPDRPRCAQMAGYSLRADVVAPADDRAALERLLTRPNRE